ncbi:MAG: hypothetical protein ACLUD2_10590 [Clostridium sp.]
MRRAVNQEVADRIGFIVNRMETACGNRWGVICEKDSRPREISREDFLPLRRSLWAQF